MSEIVAAPTPVSIPESSFDPSIVIPLESEKTSLPPPAPLLHVVGAWIALILPICGTIATAAWALITGRIGAFPLTLLIAGYLLTGLGITLGYHRLLTHRSFETYGWNRAFWMMMGALAVQKSPIEWCATHRKHHALSDRPGDPHSPHEYGTGVRNRLTGFWHAHMGWIPTGHIITSDHSRYAPDLLADPLARWIHRTWDFVWFPLAFVIPAGIGWAVTGTLEGAGMGFLWGGCVRVFLVQHMAFAVNSICHLIGRRDFQTTDESRNNLICGLLSGGEGFHNNHHAFPTSARHGLEWWQPDAAWYLIRLMQATGIVWNVKVPSAELMDRKRSIDECR